MSWLKPILLALILVIPNIAAAQPKTHNQIIPKHEFDRLYDVLSHTSDSGWEAILRKAVRNYDFTCAQIIALTDILGYYGDQADTACFFAQTDSIADPENWYTIITSRVHNRGQELITKCTPNGSRLPTPAEISAATHSQAMPEIIFADLMRTVQRTDDKEITRVIKEASYHHRFTCSQIVKVANTRHDDSIKTKVICLMSKNTADPENWHENTHAAFPQYIRQSISDCAPKIPEVSPTAPVPGKAHPVPAAHPATVPGKAYPVPAPAAHPATVPGTAHPVPTPAARPATVPGTAHPVPAPPAPQAAREMNAHDFDVLLSAVKHESFTDDQMRVIRNASQNNHFTCAQVKQIILLLSFDNDRADAACLLANRVIDKNNWFSVSSALTFSNNKQTVMNCMH